MCRHLFEIVANVTGVRFSCHVNSSCQTIMEHKKFGTGEIPVLVDFDWRLKAVLGTSSLLTQPPPPLVQVDLHLCNGNVYDEKNPVITDTLKLEMNCQELNTFITSLEKVVNL